MEPREQNSPMPTAALSSPHRKAFDALDFYRRIVRDPAICHPRSPQLDSTQSGDLFLAGEVAMMANWFGFAARAGREGSPLAGKSPSRLFLARISAAPALAFCLLGTGHGPRLPPKGTCLAIPSLRRLARTRLGITNMAPLAYGSRRGGTRHCRLAFLSIARSKPSR